MCWKRGPFWSGNSLVELNLSCEDLRWYIILITMKTMWKEYEEIQSRKYTAHQWTLYISDSNTLKMPNAYQMSVNQFPVFFYARRCAIMNIMGSFVLYFAAKLRCHIPSIEVKLLLVHISRDDDIRLPLSLEIIFTAILTLQADLSKRKPVDNKNKKDSKLWAR